MWTKAEDGKTIGQVGSENGVIILDEEYLCASRITLERDGIIAPYSITCGVYGLADMAVFNAAEELYELCELDGKPVAFTNMCLNRQTVPTGLYCYDVRDSDNCDGSCAEVKPHIMVNHWGTILCKSPFELDEHGSYYPQEDMNYKGIELFVATQFEKGSRTNTQINSDGFMQRKTIRYSSQNVLSGLLVCAECGSNYRRITRPNGEVVWRCADRVEKGKQASCKYSPTITDITIKDLICKELGLSRLDKQKLYKKILQLVIKSGCQINIMYHLEKSSQLQTIHF